MITAAEQQQTAPLPPPSGTPYHFLLAYVIVSDNGSETQYSYASGTVAVASGSTRSAVFGRLLEWVKAGRESDPSVLAGAILVLSFSLERDEL